MKTRKVITLVLLMIVSVTSFAQKKQLTDDQYFKNNFGGIVGINFISKLQGLKKDFEFMPYSSGRHGWPGNKWLHYMNMKTRFIYQNLLEKDVPAAMLK